MELLRKAPKKGMQKPREKFKVMLWSGLKNLELFQLYQFYHIQIIVPLLFQIISILIPKMNFKYRCSMHTRWVFDYLWAHVVGMYVIILPSK